MFSITEEERRKKNTCREQERQLHNSNEAVESPSVTVAFTEECSCSIAGMVHGTEELIRFSWLGSTGGLTVIKVFVSLDEDPPLDFLVASLNIVLVVAEEMTSSLYI